MSYASYVLSERVLSDNLLLVAPEGYKFKGGYKCIIKEYTFQNEWSDKESVKRFKTMESMEKYVSKYYPEFDLTDVCDVSGVQY